ncbi:MAG: class I SAM-dependent methyltransferase [Phycisphaeraceae bacterium]|nr:class I SAM-dependent methyltransferase [Phycisphaeraceae bacterium]
MRRPDRWRLYEQAVQHPEAEVAFFERAWRLRATDGGSPTPASLLCEDFCGTAEVARAWMLLGEDRRAVAIDHDPRVLKRAWRAWCAHFRRLRDAGLEPGDSLDRQADLHLLCADVMQAKIPPVHIIAALNFSILTFHQRQSLRAYLRHARRRLLPDGLLVMDLFGGPGAMMPGTVWRRVEPSDGSIEPFDYGWEQRTFDAATGRIDCRIHFRFDDGTTMRSAFRYDWRLWSPADMVEMCLAGGFRRAQIHSDLVGGQRTGRFRRTRSMPNAREFVVYIVAQR